MSDVVERADTLIEFVACDDEIEAIRAAWTALESVVPLQGNHFFGLFDGREYRACVEVKDESFGLPAALIPGGRYARTRLRGEPPALYERIGPTVQELERSAAVDETRPVIEHYRRHDEIDILVPVV